MDMSEMVEPSGLSVLPLLSRVFSIESRDRRDGRGALGLLYGIMRRINERAIASNISEGGSTDAIEYEKKPAIQCQAVLDGRNGHGENHLSLKI